MNPIVDAVAGIAKSVIERIWPDPAQQAEAQLKLAQLVQNGELARLTAETDLAKGQIAINQVEAARPSLLVSGWRPAVGWVCVGGLFYQVLVRPLLGWGASNMLGWTMPPSLELDTLMTLLFGLLGLGAYRTKEKLMGVA
jgi:hypothetical protein